MSTTKNIGIGDAADITDRRKAVRNARARLRRLRRGGASVSDITRAEQEVTNAAERLMFKLQQVGAK